MTSRSFRTTRRSVLALSAAALTGVASRAAGAAPQDELRVASHVSLAPTWFDPAETPGIITPFMLLYALHDALMKGMPGNPMAPCLAEIVPKKYVEKVGEDGFKKAPIGAGPYKFVSFTPGVELVCEAFEDYWRKKPSIRRLVFKVVPDEATRLAALQRKEVDIAYSIRGELADELLRTPGLTLNPAVSSAPFWLYFPEQWDPQSPWHDKRVRQAAFLALDRETINQALTMGHSHLTGSVFPENFEFYWQPPKPVYNPETARKLLAEAGHARGFDAGDYYCDASYANIGEVVLNNLREVGIRVKLRPLERAAFFKAYSEKKLKNIVQGASGALGNCATRAEAFVAKGGTYAYGSYPDIDALFAEQAVQMDRAKRTTILHRLQQLVQEKAMYAPIWQLAFLSGVGPRVGQSGFGLIAGFAYTAPYEDRTLKGQG